MSLKTINWGVETLVCVAILAMAACTNGTSPTAASPPTPAPASTPTPAPATTASVQVAINPNPVPFSGQPITDSAGCAGSVNTWFYQQNFKESNGVAVTLTARTDKFDQRVVNNAASVNIAIPAMGAMTLQSRWCSSAGVAHTAQSSFSGTDVNGHTVTVDGPVVDLKSP
jgi:hypothetical protein